MRTFFFLDMVIQARTGWQSRQGTDKLFGPSEQLVGSVVSRTLCPDTSHVIELRIILIEKEYILHL